MHLIGRQKNVKIIKNTAGLGNMEPVGVKKEMKEN